MIPKKNIVTPIAIIIGGVLLAGGMVASKSPAEKTGATAKPILVQAIAFEKTDRPIPVRGTGTVVAAQQVAVVPQVSGKIVSTDPRLMPGGRFEGGEVIARIESRDYRASLEQAQSNAQRAELELALESGRGQVAVREWAILNDDASPASDLAMRKPHLALAEQSLIAATSALGAAQLNLDRTRLTAPFNAVVVSKNIDIGQVVGPGAAVAMLVGTDALWINVSLPLGDLDVIQLQARDGTGSKARIIHRLSQGRQLEYEGVALQLGGALDSATRQAQITVAVERPFDQDNNRIPLLPGAYVEVIFEGLLATEVFQIPRVAVYDGDTVWVNADGVLTPRQVHIVGGDKESVLVDEGLEDGDEVIISALSMPLAGMPVTVAGSTK
jgi:RND family efflux transporter MFP subunit